MVTATYRPLSEGPRDVGQKGTKVIGLASITLNTGEDENFVITNIRVLRTVEGKEYIQMPSYNVAPAGKEAKWVEPAHPITHKGRAVAEAAIMAAKAEYESKQNA